jgi:hypothetical protein
MICSATGGEIKVISIEIVIYVPIYIAFSGMVFLALYQMRNK